MDLAAHISEIINEQGSLVLPGIGVFKQVRMHGYYNAAEGKLYPPFYQVNFEAGDTQNDTSLVQYIAQKTNVSANSARYFVDRYLTNLLQQAEIGEVALSRLGWLSKDSDLFQFRPNTSNAENAPAAFGFSPVSIRTPQAEPDVAAIEPVTAPLSETPQNQPTVIAAVPPVTPQAQRPLAEDTPTSNNTPASKATMPTGTVKSNTETPVAKNSSNKTLITAAIAVVVVAVIGLILFKYADVNKDDATNNIQAKNAVATPSTDSIAIQQPAKPDTQIKTQAGTIDSSNTPAANNYGAENSAQTVASVHTDNSGGLVNTNNYKFALVGGAYMNEAEANNAIKRYKELGINTAILEGGFSKYVKVCLGYFKTYADGQAAKQNFVKTTKVNKANLYVETIRTKKK